MNVRKAFQVLVLAAFPIAAVAIGCSSSSSSGGNGTCSSVCANQPSCSGSTPTSCLTQCAQLQTQCNNAGQGPAGNFQAYLDCASGITSSQYSCGAAGGVQVNTTQCAQQEVTVVQTCVGGTITLDGGGGDTSVNPGGGSCASVCALQPAACSTNCVGQCAQLQSQCATANQTAAFNAFISCASSMYTASDFTCNGGTVVNSSNACNAQISALSACAGSTGVDSGPPGFDTGVPPTDSSTTTDSPTGDAACLANPATCQTCCVNNHMTGVGVLDQAIITCDCGAGAGGCQTACATEICANPPVGTTAGDACDTCISTSLGMTGACLQPVLTACQGNTDCNAYLTCSNQTNCN